MHFYLVKRTAKSEMYDLLLIDSLFMQRQFPNDYLLTVYMHYFDFFDFFIQSLSLWTSPLHAPLVSPIGLFPLLSSSSSLSVHYTLIVSFHSYGTPAESSRHRKREPGQVKDYIVNLGNVEAEALIS